MVKTTEDKNGNVKIYFGVGDMPMKVYEEFENFTKREYGGCRWMAIKSLKDFYEARKDVMYLIEELENIKQELFNIKDTREQPDGQTEPDFNDYVEEGTMTLGSQGVKYKEKKGN